MHFNIARYLYYEIFYGKCYKMLMLPLQLETESRCINAKHHFFSLHSSLLYAYSYRNIYIFILQDKNLTFHNQTYTMLINPILGTKTLNQGA